MKYSKSDALLIAQKRSDYAFACRQKDDGIIILQKAGQKLILTL